MAVACTKNSGWVAGGNGINIISGNSSAVTLNGNGAVAGNEDGDGDGVELLLVLGWQLVSLLTFALLIFIC